LDTTKLGRKKGLKKRTMLLQQIRGIGGVLIMHAKHVVLILYSCTICYYAALFCHAGKRGPKSDLTEAEFNNVQNGITDIL
jgi:adenine C2-methylase RlmN of 23S rRNA A2503 and tRNA A37